MSKRFQLSRRSLLMGAGTLVGLPFLEAMLPFGRAEAATAASPLRLVVFHFPIGVNRAGWAPGGSGTSWTLGASQQPLAAHKGDLCVLTGIDMHDPSASGAHTCGIASFLSARDVPQGVQSMGTTADQMVAQSLVGKTRIPSLQLGTSILDENPNAESGYSPVLKDHLSWLNDTPLPKEIDPGKVWDRMFAGTNATQTAQEAARRLHYGQSVLDTVRGDASRLQAKLGTADKAKLDQYFTGLRQVESTLQANTANTCSPGTRPAATTDIRAQVKAMLDLTVLSLQCDVTRVVTFGYEHTVTEQTHPWIGVNDGYHIGVTHNQPGAPYVAVNKWIVSQLAYLLDQMKAVTEPGGTLLDNSVVYFSSELGEGSNHDDTNLPMIVAGKGGGRIQPGRLLSYDGQGYGNGNVLISLMDVFGLNVTNFGNGFKTPIPGLIS